MFFLFFGLAPSITYIFDENRRAEKAGKKSGNAEPYDEKGGKCRAGGREREDTCEQALSRRSLRVKALYELSWKIKGDDKSINQNIL